MTDRRQKPRDNYGKMRRVELIYLIRRIQAERDRLRARIKALEEFRKYLHG